MSLDQQTLPSDGSPRITVDATSAVPPFEQVRTGIAEQIRTGILPPGTKLPTVRGLAKELALAANTVARAYRQLETAGLVETRRRRGTVVAASGDAVQQKAAKAASEFADAMHRLGVSEGDAVALVRAALQARAS